MLGVFFTLVKSGTLGDVTNAEKCTWWISNADKTFVIMEKKSYLTCMFLKLLLTSFSL